MEDEGIALGKEFRGRVVVDWGVRGEEEEEEEKRDGSGVEGRHLLTAEANSSEYACPSSMIYEQVRESIISHHKSLPFSFLFFFFFILVYIIVIAGEHIDNKQFKF